MKISRRHFLTAASLVALVVGSPHIAEAWIHGSATSLFNGNPNVTITAIDTSGGIACSRPSSPSTAGAIPCFVHVSAKNIIATGTSQPYEDLSYSWNFGDATLGVETFINPVTGATVNANTAQTGPEAAYVYRTTGTYFIVLTISGKNSSGYISTTKTLTVIVGAWTPTDTVYADANSGGTNSGTLSNPYTSMSSLNAGISAMGSSKRVQINLARASNFGGAGGASAGMILPNGTSSFRVSPYGSGADPIITVNGSTSAINPGTFLGGGGRDDLVFQNITLTNASGFTGTQLFGVVWAGTPTSYTNVYVDNLTLTDTIAPSSFANYLISGGHSSTPIVDGWGVWKCTITSPLNSTLNRMGITFQPAGTTASNSWFFVMGGSIAGACGSNVLDHHIYPIVRYNSLYCWVNFGASGAGANQRNYCINIDWNNTAGGDSQGTLQTAGYINISGCYFSGALRTVDAGNSINIPLTVQFSNMVFQNNAISNLNSSNDFTFGCAVNFTLRDNNIWNSTGVFVPSGTVTGVGNWKFYRNKVYSPITGTALGSVIQLSRIAYAGCSTTAGSPNVSKILLGFPINTKVAVTASSDATIPNGDYFVVATGYVSGSGATTVFSLQLSTTLNGTAINATNNGTLTLTSYVSSSLTVTDNYMQDMRSGASASTGTNFIAIPFSDTVGAIIDRNSYYAPNQSGWNANSTLMMFDILTQKTFTQWQSSGFDMNGLLPLSGFGWVDPANGQF